MFTYDLLPIDYSIERQMVAGHRFYQDPIRKKWVPSATTVLNVIQKKSLERWKQEVGAKKAKRIKEEAADRGDAVHKLIEEHLQNSGGVVLENIDNPKVKKLFNQLKMECNKKVDNINLQESTLFSSDIGVAGTVDLVAEYNGKLSIIDFKTATSVKKDEYVYAYKLQIALYQLMIHEMFGIEIDNAVVMVSCEKLPVCQTFTFDPREYISDAVHAVVDYYKKYEDFIEKVNSANE